MIDDQILAREPIIDDGVDRRETVETEYVGTPRHGDEEAGGAVVGGVAGIVVGAVVGGPVGAVVGGAIGAAAGATAGLIDQNSKDGEVVVTREEPRL